MEPEAYRKELDNFRRLALLAASALRGMHAVQARVMAGGDPMQMEQFRDAYAEGEAWVIDGLYPDSLLPQ